MGINFHNLSVELEWPDSFQIFPQDEFLLLTLYVMNHKFYAVPQHCNMARLEDSLSERTRVPTLYSLYQDWWSLGDAIKALLELYMK